jgi:hypothetical protein
MDENKTESAVDEFLGDLKNNDGDGVFEVSKENPFDDQVIETKEEEVKEEKALPFNQDPKIQRYIRKEVEKLTKDLTPRQTEQFQKEVSQSKDEDDLVGAFTNIIGNDTPEKVHALKMLDRTIKGLEDKAMSATRQLEAERQADIEAEQELEQGFENIEDTFNVDISSATPQARETRKKFIEFVEKIAPKDEYGEIKEYPDFEQTFDLFQKLNKPQPNLRARELASRGMTRTSEASNATQVQGNSWKDVEKAISGMFK